MKSYYRIMLGKKSMYADECYRGNYIGVDRFKDVDLTDQLPENWRDFNKKFIPLYIARYPGTSKISAGLACGSLRVVSKWILKWDIILCPNGKGSYFVGEIIDNYAYYANENNPHRRAVRRYTKNIEKTEMSQALQNSCGSIGTVSNITKHAEEIENLIAGNRPSPIIPTKETEEEAATFVLEKHLEDFLVENWKSTEIGKYYDIFQENGELVGQQYLSDTGPIDILAISKDKKELLVVELKKGKVSDAVIGQVQRYMWYVQEELAENGQVVKWVIIGLDADTRIRRALQVAKNIEFYKYQISFKLIKG